MNGEDLTLAREDLQYNWEKDKIVLSEGGLSISQPQLSEVGLETTESIENYISSNKSKTAIAAVFDCLKLQFC